MPGGVVTGGCIALWICDGNIALWNCGGKILSSAQKKSRLYGCEPKEGLTFLDSDLEWDGKKGQVSSAKTGLKLVIKGKI